MTRLEQEWEKAVERFNFLAGCIVRSRAGEPCKDHVWEKTGAEASWNGGAGFITSQDYECLVCETKKTEYGQ